MHLVNLRILRLERRMSQKRLGERVGIPQTVVSQIERGIAVRNRTLIGKLAKALKVEPSRLIGPPLVALDDSESDQGA